MKTLGNLVADFIIKELKEACFREDMHRNPSYIENWYRQMDEETKREMLTKPLNEILSDIYNKFVIKDVKERAIPFLDGYDLSNLDEVLCGMDIDDIFRLYYTSLLGQNADKDYIKLIKEHLTPNPYDELAISDLLDLLFLMGAGTSKRIFFNKPNKDSIGFTVVCVDVSGKLMYYIVDESKPKENPFIICERSELNFHLLYNLGKYAMKGNKDKVMGYVLK